MLHNNFTGGIVKTTAGTGSSSLTRKVEDGAQNSNNTENSNRVRQQGNVRIRATSASMRTKPPTSDNKGLPPKSGQRGPAAAAEINNENIYNNMFANH